MIQTTSKAPTWLLKTLNQSTGKYSTWATSFNDVSCGELTRTLLKLITFVLRPESYDKIVVGAKAIAAKTRRTTHADNVIDLTVDKPPAEFAMLVDNPSDDEDGDDNDKGRVRFEGDDSIEVEGHDNIKIKGEEDVEFENEEYDDQDDQEQGVMEEEYKELNNSAAEDLEDDEDKDDEDD